jgi:two-component system chemotaxis sensor kinase CheA
MFHMDELLGEFLAETNENLALLDGELVKLEKNPNNHDLLAQIFRIVHTIKGTCGFLSLDRLEKVAHAAENVLGKLRDKELTATPDIVTVILQALDKIKDIISILEETEKEPDGNDGQLVEKLNEISEDSKQIQHTKLTQEEINASIDDLFSKKTQSIIATNQTNTEPQHLTEQIEKNDESNAAQLIEKTFPKDSVIAGQSIRVNIDLLEKLMNLVSELVLTRNQLLQISRRQSTSEFSAPLQHLSHITSELQEGVMKTRMQPISNAWAKLPRMVRDLSLELGKSIDLQLIGSETELDRQVLELIKDPLTHMIRNAADHGIETIQERRHKGKKDTGNIILEAFHEGGHIIIKIQDDGKGIDSEKIKNKIIEKNLATSSELQHISEQQLHQFIFKPGFSTAAKVTSVSGRGVGMDVVRTNIEQIGGTIEFSSNLDKGSIFIIKIPLTLAIVSALIIASGNERFAIPQLNVLELVKPSKQSNYQIETINDAPILRLRNNLLPLISLKQLLKLENEPTETSNEGFIIVTQVGAHIFGIIVDKIYDTEEIVVKPVSPLLQNLTIFLGNTILGDGSVILILDPNGLAIASGVTATRKDSNLDKNDPKISQDQQHIDFIIFKAGSNDLKAIPLSLVSRLEEIDVTTIEHSANEKPLVQYRGKLMPLIKVNNQTQLKKEGTQPILVFSDNDRQIGLIVDDIIDIIKDKMSIEIKKTEDGIIGSAIINGKATDVIDIGFYLTKIFNNGFSSKNTIQNTNHPKTKNILLVDDSHFFRNQLTPFLVGAGYNVTTTKSAEDALDFHEKGDNFDIIITDIEMPGISGFEFADIIRHSEKWHNTPIIALSAYINDENLERSKSLGIQNYISKLDRDALIETLTQLS